MNNAKQLEIIFEEKHIHQTIYNFLEETFNKDIKLECDASFLLSIIEKLSKNLTERIINYLDAINENLDYLELIKKCLETKCPNIER